jgi:hypothetical protein
MGCEALDALGRPDAVDRWSRTPDPGNPAVGAVRPERFDWQDALGDPARTAEWLGFFDRAVADDGWEPVVRLWVPRLLPALAAALFHGAIRTAHAVRAVSGADTPARRAELARSLGYWAACATPGERPGPATGDDPATAIVTAAAGAARHYVARPNIFQLHGVTGAMALALLADHVGGAAAAAGLAQLRAEHAALHAHTEPGAVEDPGLGDEELADAAVASGEVHAVKLVEACRRGSAATGDAAFAAAAERVVRRTLRGRRAAGGG